MTVILKPEPQQTIFKQAKFIGEEIEEQFTNPLSWQVKAVNSGIRASLRYGKFSLNRRQEFMINFQ